MGARVRTARVPLRLPPAHEKGRLTAASFYCGNGLMAQPIMW